MLHAELEHVGQVGEDHLVAKGLHPALAVVVSGLDDEAVSSSSDSDLAIALDGVLSVVVSALAGHGERRYVAGQVRFQVGDAVVDIASDDGSRHGKQATAAHSSRRASLVGRGEDQAAIALPHDADVSLKNSFGHCWLVICHGLIVLTMSVSHWFPTR